MTTDQHGIIIPDELRPLNRRRCDRWHPPTGDDWTLGDWSNAVCGEVGELANVVKKLRRHEGGHATSYNTPEVAELRARFAEEVADVLLYLDLLAWKAGVTPAELRATLRDKFNLVSNAQGWDDLQWEMPTVAPATIAADADPASQETGSRAERLVRGEHAYGCALGQHHTGSCGGPRVVRRD